MIRERIRLHRNTGIDEAREYIVEGEGPQKTLAAAWKRLFEECAGGPEGWFLYSRVELPSPSGAPE